MVVLDNQHYVLKPTLRTMHMLALSTVKYAYTNTPARPCAELNYYLTSIKQRRWNHSLPSTEPRPYISTLSEVINTVN